MVENLISFEREEAEFVNVTFNWSFTVPNNPEAIERAKNQLEADIKNASKAGELQGYCEVKENPDAESSDVPDWF